MKDAGDRQNKQKLEIDDGLKNKIKEVSFGTILNKEKKKRKKRGGGGWVYMRC